MVPLAVDTNTMIISLNEPRNRYACHQKHLSTSIEHLIDLWTVTRQHESKSRCRETREKINKKQVCEEHLSKSEERTKNLLSKKT